MLNRAAPSHRLVDEGGFTLIELLVAMTVLTVGVTVSWSALVTTTVKSATRSQELATLQTEVRSTVDELAADLRQATCNGTTPPITTASGTQLIFYSPDRVTASTAPQALYHLRQISYQLAGGNLNRAFATSTNTGGPPWTIPALGSSVTRIGSITNGAVFTYEDSTGAATTTLANIASVNIALAIAPRPGLGGVGVNYTTAIDLRTPTCA